MVVYDVLQEEGIVRLKILGFARWEVAVSAEKCEECLWEQESRSILSADLEYPKSVDEKKGFGRVQLKVFLVFDCLGFSFDVLFHGL